MKKIEKLDSTLFNEKIEKSEMSQVLGGAKEPSSVDMDCTYVTINTDYRICWDGPDTSVGANNCIPIVNDDSCTCPDD